MGEVHDLLRKRRSIRSYRPDPVPEEMLLTILDCARLGPSGHNSQDWKFVVVRDKVRRDKLAAICQWGSFFAQAAVCVAIFSGPEAKTRVEDASSAAMSMIMAAEGFGLGSCWVWANKCPHTEEAAKLLNAPDDYELLELLAIGWPDESPTREKKPLEDVVVWEAFP